MPASCVPSFLFLLLVGFPLSAPTARSQARADSGQVTLRAEALRDGNTVVLGDEPWRYHAGDDPAWADPALDDAGWMLLPPNVDPDTLAEGVWTGVGWFRLRLQVGDGLRNTTLALSLFHLGASEVYLDGEKVGGYGAIGTSAADEKPYNPKGLPIGLHLDDRAEHVLAVRYAYRTLDSWRARKIAPNARHPRGFFILVQPINRGIRSFYYRTLEAPFTVGLLIGVSLLLGGLHLLLYLFDRQERANLYFSLYAVLSAIVIYYAGAFDSAGLFLPDIGKNLWLWGIGFRAVLVCMLAAYHQVFYRRLLPVFWVVVGIAVLSLASATWMPSWSSTLLAAVVFAESARVTGVAIWKKKNGAWILGGGLLVLLLDAVFILTAGNQLNAPNKPLLLEASETLQLWVPFSLLILVIYLSIPIAMSVLLARRFSQTSRTLRVQLDKVEALSERTLAQEREKQALIAQQNERLETEVTERTAELRRSLTDLQAAQARLVQAEKMASLGQLTAGIAHEIKNPLNFVNNFSEIVVELAAELTDELDRDADTTLRDVADDFRNILADLGTNAEQIIKHGRRADAIVRSMMQHASGGTGERVATDVNALVDEYVDLAYHGKRAQVPDFTCAVEKDLGTGVGTVEMIPQEMARVLLNLLSNAFDAVSEGRRAKGEGGETQGHRGGNLEADGTRRGVQLNAPLPQPTVSVTTRRTDGQVEIRVSDNGPGIPAELQEKIFEPFFTTKPTGSGTGLGLSLSYDIVTQGHGGTLTVESEKGHGATFIVTLPVHHAAPPRTPNASPENTRNRPT